MTVRSDVKLDLALTKSGIFVNVRSCKLGNADQCIRNRKPGHHC